MAMAPAMPAAAAPRSRARAARASVSLSARGSSRSPCGVDQQQRVVVAAEGGRARGWPRSAARPCAPASRARGAPGRGSRRRSPRTRGAAAAGRRATVARMSGFSVKLQRRRAAAAVLLDLVLGAGRGAPVGHGGGGDEDVVPRRLGQHGVEHLHARCCTSMRRTPRGVGRCTGPATSVTARAGLGGGARDRKTHLAAGVVGDAAHRVDGLEGGPGGDQHRAAGQQLGLEEGDQLVAQFGGLEHAAVADLAAGLVAGRRARARWRRRRRSAPRCAASPGAPTSRGSWPAPPAAGSVRSGRARHSRLSSSPARPCASWAMKSALAGATSIASASRERSMCAMLLGWRASHWLREDGPAAERLHRHGGDELRRRLGHHHLHGGAGLDQFARQLGGLVAGDAARQAEHDVFALQGGGGRHGARL